VIVIAVTLPLHAQEANAPLKEGHARPFDQKIWKEVVGATDYSENVRPPRKQRKEEKADGTSSGRRVKESDEDEEEDDDEAFSIPGLPIDSLMLNIIVYAIVAALIVCILFIVIRSIRLGGDRKVGVPPSADQAVAVENIQELEIDAMLRNALAAGNYRLAIRIYFLGLLKKLDSGGHIRWKKDKTNRDYLSELYLAKHYFEEVQRLTLDYEQVWYGEHDLTLQHYQDVITSFQAMDQKLNLTTP